MRISETIEILFTISRNPDIKKAEKDGFTVIFQNSNYCGGWLGLEFTHNHDRLNTKLLKLPLVYANDEITTIVNLCRESIENQISISKTT